MDPACDLPAGFLDAVFQRLDVKDLCGPLPARAVLLWCRRSPQNRCRGAVELVSKAWLAVAQGHAWDLTLRLGPGPLTPRLECFSAWAARRNMQRLTLCSDSQTECLDLSPLAGVTSLKTLELKAMLKPSQGPIDWASLQCVKSLRRVIIDPTDFLYGPGDPPYATVADVEEYHSGMVGDVEDLDKSLACLPELVEVDLLGPESYDIGPLSGPYCHLLHWYQPSCLPDLTRLTSLAITCPDVRGTAWNLPLRELSILVALSTDQGARVLDFTRETFGSSLTRLALHNVKLRGTFAALPSALQDLRLVGAALERPTLAPLKHQLTQLRLVCPYENSEAQGLGELSALKVLWLYAYCPRDLRDVAKLQGLEELIIVPLWDPRGPLSWMEPSEPLPQAADWEEGMLSAAAQLPELRLLDISLPREYTEGRNLQRVRVGNRVVNLALLQERLQASGCRVVRKGMGYDDDDDSEAYEEEAFGTWFIAP